MSTHSRVARLLMPCLFALATSAGAQQPPYDPLDDVTDLEPQLRFDTLDSERLVTRRIDLVDEQGVVRVTLAAPLPNPVVDGIEYRRDRPVHGLMLRDAEGNERGGIAFLDQLNWPALILDHGTSEAAGLVVREDGSMVFMMVAPGEERRDARLDGRRVPSGGGPVRLLMQVPADDQPSIDLVDEQDRPRLRLTLTPSGAGSIQFLDAQGNVVHAITPEEQAAP